MKRNLPDFLLLALGLAVMALLLYLGAASQGWVSLFCFLATAFVYFGWYRQLLKFAWRLMGHDEEADDDDQPFFPG